MSEQNSNLAALKALKEEFATSLNKMYVNSLKEFKNFREITVLEQKTLSKVLIANENNKDVVYDAQCALINKVCEDENFDIYKLSEFDKIKLLMLLYQSNFFKQDVEFKCPKCGAQNKVKLDFTAVIKKLDDFDLSDKKLEYDDGGRHYSFIVNYPLVSKVSNFYKYYMKKYSKNISPKERETLDDFSNTEYMNLFIKSISVSNKSKPEEHAITVDLSDVDYEELDKLISVFPQDVLYNDDGVLKFIMAEFIEKINSVFETAKCAQCGEVYHGAAVENVPSFF